MASGSCSLACEWRPPTGSGRARGGTNGKPLPTDDLGLAAIAVREPPQRQGDFEYQATFSAFTFAGQPNDRESLRYLHSSATRLPSNNFRVPQTGNRSRYMNQEFDALLDAY